MHHKVDMLTRSGVDMRRDEAERFDYVPDMDLLVMPDENADPPLQAPPETPSLNLGPMDENPDLLAPPTEQSPHALQEPGLPLEETPLPGAYMKVPPIYIIFYMKVPPIYIKVPPI